MSLQGKLPASSPAHRHSDFSAVLGAMTISSQQDPDLSPGMDGLFLGCSIPALGRGSGCSLDLLLLYSSEFSLFFTSQSFITPIPYYTSLFYILNFSCPNYSVVSVSSLDSD